MNFTPFQINFTLYFFKQKTQYFSSFFILSLSLSLYSDLFVFTIYIYIYMYIFLVFIIQVIESYFNLWKQILIFTLFTFIGLTFFRSTKKTSKLSKTKSCKCRKRFLFFAIGSVGNSNTKFKVFFSNTIFIWFLLYNMHLIVYDLASSNVDFVFLLGDVGVFFFLGVDYRIWDFGEYEIVGVIWFYGMGCWIWCRDWYKLIELLKPKCYGSCCSNLCLYYFWLLFTHFSFLLPLKKILNNLVGYSYEKHAKLPTIKFPTIHYLSRKNS